MPDRTRGVADDRATGLPLLALVADAATEFAAAPDLPMLAHALARRLACAASAESTTVWLASRGSPDPLTLVAAWPSDASGAAPDAIAVHDAPLAAEALARGRAIDARLSDGPAAPGLAGPGEHPVWVVPVVAGARRLGVAYVVRSRAASHQDQVGCALSALGCQAALAAAALAPPHPARQDDAEFLAIVAHDLKNVATSIKGYTQLIRRHLPAEAAPRAGRWTGIVEDQVGVLTDTLSALVDLGRLQSGRHGLDVESVDLGQVLTAVAARLPAEADAPPLRVRLSATPVVGRWDARRLERALHRALDSARRGVPPETEAIDVTLDADGARAWLRLGTPPAGEPWPGADRWAAGADASLHLLRGLVAIHDGTMAYERTADGHPLLAVCLPLDAHGKG